MYETILFDLDGTLTDPKPGITKSVRHALGKFGIDVASLDDLVPFIGPPLAQSFRDFYGFSERQSLEAVGHYREYFSDKGLYENRVYDGIPELLEALAARGRTAAVATSKPTVFAQKIIGHFGLSGFFRGIFGSNMDNTRTDKAEVIAHALAELGRGAAGTVMVGDRKHDIIGARKHGMDSIGVSYGYGSPGELRDAGPNRIVGSARELAEALLG